MSILAGICRIPMHSIEINHSVGSRILPSIRMLQKVEHYRRILRNSDGSLHGYQRLLPFKTHDLLSHQSFLFVHSKYRNKI